MNPKNKGASGPPTSLSIVNRRSLVFETPGQSTWLDLEPGRILSLQPWVESFDPVYPYSMVQTYINQPLLIMLVSGPFVQTYREGVVDRLWRAVAVSPKELWNRAWNEDDDQPLLVKDPASGKTVASYTAHLWLEYPVSESQFYRGVATGPVPKPLQEEGGNPTPRSDEQQRRRDSLLYLAQVLCQNADARRARMEWLRAEFPESMSFQDCFQKWHASPENKDKVMRQASTAELTLQVRES